MRSVWMRGAGVAALVGSMALAAPADAQDNADDTVFVLGRIDSGIANSDGESVSASSISGEDLRTFDRASVDEAMDLIPGANASPTGGSRNERLIFIRGFDRFQTTLSIEGVRVFPIGTNHEGREASECAHSLNVCALTRQMQPSGKGISN